MQINLERVQNAAFEHAHMLQVVQEQHDMGGQWRLDQCCVKRLADAFAVTSSGVSDGLKSVGEPIS